MIHPKAVVDQGVVLGSDVKVGAYAVIEEGVKLGNGVSVKPFAHLKGKTEVGDNTVIGTGALIGEAPQILGIRKNEGKLFIGKSNIIREYVTIHTSSSPDKMTSVGDNNYLMGFSHVAHDCRLENNIVVCNGALLAGHINVGSNAFISGNVVVHQFVRVGRLAMIAGLSRVNQDVPPFMMVVGNSKVWGLNLVGIKRERFSKSEIEDTKKAYNILYRKRLSVKNALNRLQCINSQKAQEIAQFISGSRRGICGHKRGSFFEKIFLDYPYFLCLTVSSFRLLRKRQRGAK
ncbi:MAG: acyl-ACP--UDP-N-acetylglucosamine O-acyltransferase [Candidatus Omnitrophota bacterium]|nr:MAG: acyl-ACP--UDP-N-acetylglucosamine O-acyltransferase [Candidatus Omnitrophota bacterium]